jgi:ubiquinol-cytochrome c reductase cytochrome b subunit
MLAAILIILILPKTDLGLTKQFRPLSKAAFYVFLVNFLMLMQLGAKHVESPFIEIGQLSTALYFSHFLFILPAVSILENTLVDLELQNNSKNI